MAEKQEFAAIIRASWGDAVVLLSTFLFVVFRDLSQGILVGFGIGALLFLHRMAQAVEIETGTPPVEPDIADVLTGPHYDGALASDPGVVVCRISGAFFFGAAETIGAALDRIGEHPRLYVIDVAAVPVLDSTAAATIRGFVHKARKRSSAVYVSGARPAIRKTLLSHGVGSDSVGFAATVAEAVAAHKAASGADRAHLSPAPV
jgi:SulP family sulfate permease